MPALIFLVIATAGGNLFGFLSQLAYNSGILSKFAVAEGARVCPLFSCPGGWGGCRTGRTAGQKGCGGWMKGPLSPDERGLFAG